MGEARAARIPAAFELVVDPDPMARAGALLETLLRRLAGRTTSALRVAIPGGSALAAVEIAAKGLGSLWGRVALTWVDERCVPLASAPSNRGEAMRRGLIPAATDRAPSRDGLATPATLLPLFEDGEPASAAVARVTRRFAADFGGALDVVVLGLGEDGHVASLFPGRASDAADTSPVRAIDDSPKPPRDRITLTRRALTTAHHTLLVAAGEAKRDALTRLAHGDPTLPATGLPGLVVVTDLDLALDRNDDPNDDPRDKEKRPR